MIEHRPFNQLGGEDHGWLKAKHHFSFAGHRDATRMGWGALRVWNDDEIAPNAGFPPHPHANMEIITYVREGAVTHKDSLGNEGRTEAGDVQVMSAGTGIRHAEYNLEQQPTRIFQIWITPSSNGGPPVAGDVQVMSAGTGIRHAEYNLERQRPSLPRLSLCVTAPSRTYVTISMLACGWGGKPALGAISSSFQTRSAPQPIREASP
jgi:redox-sensitive bicupin YhaK (pirin superfamily)